MFAMTPWRKENGAGNEMMEPFDRLRHDFKALYDRFFGTWPLIGEHPEWAGAYPWNLEVKETEKEYVVRAEVPGFEANEVEVKLHRDRLFVKAEHKAGAKTEAGDEKVLRRFERVVTLPAPTEPEKVEALYRNGVLEVHLPRTKEELGLAIPVKT